MKILLVEDDYFMRDSLERLLNIHGYDVVSVSDGREAIEIINKEHFKVIITDLLMPNISGYKLIKEFKKCKPNTIIIVITAYENEYEKLKEAKINPNFLLIKPFKIEELINILDKVS